MVICADGLSGIKEAISAAFPKTEYQRCIVHQVRNTLKYVSYKDMKEFAADLKKIYLAPDEAKSKEQLDRVTEKWNSKYPNSMKSWHNNWDVLTPIFKFLSDVRKIRIVGKRQKDISEIDRKIIAMYGRGMTTRQISEEIEDIYGFDVSESFVSDVTDKILREIKEWKARPLDDVYPIVFIDAVHFSVRKDKSIQKLAAYVALGINLDGIKDVLGVYIGENESSKYWLGILNELKARGVKDILVMCADGLTGIKESIAVALPNAEYQRCIVHQVRNTLKHVPYKDKKAFANDLKTIYHADTEEKGYSNMQEVTEKWNSKYPNAMKSWENNWDAIVPIFKFSKEVRKVIYTTNAIESLNSTYKRLNRQRSVFPSETALLKAFRKSNKEMDSAS